MMKKYSLFLLVALLVSCDSSSELSDSIYVPDPIFDELPAYTEWGYNTFGANYERSIFIYTNHNIPLKVTVKDDSLSFIFQGRSELNLGDEYMALRFTLPDTMVQVYQDLMVFDDSIIDLSTGNLSVALINESGSRYLDIPSGELHFRRAQRVYVDDEEREVILSGTFYLQFLNGSIPLSMSDGRFDCGINALNLYNLN